MKILWLCNIVLPDLCDEFGFKRVKAGGWLTGMWNELIKNTALELGICVPIRNNDYMRDGTRKNYRYFSFHMMMDEEDLSEQEDRFCEILKKFNPDIIHIWGTEYSHSYAMIRAAGKCSNIDKVIIHIQGLVSVCAQHYTFGLPSELLGEETGGSSIADEIEDFRRRGEYETALLKCVHHVAGRTEWDQACSRQINPLLRYHHCTEILREEFYLSPQRWDVNKCERHSIFISQASYPIKGFHLILNALSELAERYKDLRVYISGGDLWERDTSYAAFIRQKIYEYRLESIIEFAGMCTAAGMYQHYLKANVFVLASTIENSSNSVCEAMKVGVPVVSSYVGGIPSIITHRQSGLLYPLDESYMMQYYVSQIFDDDSLALSLSCNARARAEQFNDKEKAVTELMQIYQEISNGN